MHTFTSKNTGFSLIELMVCLSVLAILITFAVPSANQLIRENTRIAATNGYFGLFAFARYKAAISRKATTLCPLDDTGTCHDAWNQPVSVFPDNDRDGKPDNGTVWRVLASPPKAFRVFSRTGGKGYFRFYPTGETHGLPGSLVICPVRPGNHSPSYLAVNRGGRLYQLTDDDHDGAIELPWGVTISC